jgi:methylisocitrate lyase
MIGRLEAAVAGKSDPEFVIIARTDAVAVEGLDAAIDRACRYRDAGADMIFRRGVHGTRALRGIRPRAEGARAGEYYRIRKDTALHRGATSWRGCGDGALSFVGFSRDECRRHRDLSGHPYERDAEFVISRMQTREELYETLDYHALETQIDRAQETL